jgi:exodeoxyribonuclease VII small subunit
MDEVETILGRLEEDTIDIDDLAAEVQRAVELIKVCREKLDRTDREVRELVAELEDDGDPSASDEDDDEDDDDDRDAARGRAGGGGAATKASTMKNRSGRAGESAAGDLPF